MANIERRVTNNKVTYRVKIRLKGYPVASATFERLTRAKQWAIDTEISIKEGRYFSEGNTKDEHLLSEAIERYVANVLPGKPKMMIKQKSQLKYWKEEIGEFYIHKITPSVIVAARDKLAQGETYRKINAHPRQSIVIWQH